MLSARQNGIGDQSKRTCDNRRVSEEGSEKAWRNESLTLTWPRSLKYCFIRTSHLRVCGAKQKNGNVARPSSPVGLSSLSLWLVRKLTRKKRD